MMTAAAPSSAGQLIMAVIGSAIIRDPSTSSTVIVWSGCRCDRGFSAPWFQFLAAMAANVSGLVPWSCIRRCAHSAKKAAGIVINGAGFTTTSVAIHDALKAVSVPAIEVHVTNIFAREAWRHASVIAPVAKATMAGFGIHGYALAIEAMAQFAKTKLAQPKPKR